MKSITEWFNIYNKEHLTALKHRLETGSWPLGFNVPGDVRLTVDWENKLMSKVTLCLIDEVLLLQEDQNREIHTYVA